MKTVKTVHWCRCKPPPEATLSLCHQDVRCRHHRHRPHLHQRNQQGRPPLTPRLMPWGNLGLLKCPSSKILQPTSKGSTGSTGSAAETDPIALMKTSKDCRCRSKTGYLVALVVIGSRNLLQPSIQAPTSHGHPFLSSITSGLDFSLNFNSLFLLLPFLLSHHGRTEFFYICFLHLLLFLPYNLNPSRLPSISWRCSSFKLRLVVIDHWSTGGHPGGHPGGQLVVTQVVTLALCVSDHLAPSQSCL